MTVSNKQIPSSFRAYRPKFIQRLGKIVLKIFGWTVKGTISHKHSQDKLVIIVAPHTSNWDGILGIATVAGLDARITFIGKHTCLLYTSDAADE